MATVAAPTMTAKIGDGALTVEGTLLGTLQYMAPEQIDGQPSDARTDLFAFGAVLFEMLAGRPAFQGKSPASLLGSILKDEPPLVTREVVAVPHWITSSRPASRGKSRGASVRREALRRLGRELVW